MHKCLFLLGVLCLLYPLKGYAEEYGFFSLGADQVNLRAGPAERFPIKWVYQEKNYPVEVIDQFENWRQIREADGTIGWVHQKMLKETRYVVIEEEDKLLASPVASGKVIAYVQPGVIARVRSCPQGDYCLLQFFFCYFTFSPKTYLSRL